MAFDTDYLILDTNEQKIERRMMDRRTDIAKFRSKSEKHKSYLRRELQEELKDFNKYRREVLEDVGPIGAAASSGQLYMNSKLRTLNSFMDFDEEDGEQPQLILSIWDRLAQREHIARKEWRHLKPEDLNKPLEDTIGRVASFSRAYKDYDKFKSKHDDMVKGNEVLEDQQHSNKEKKQLIKIQAKKCYDSLIKAHNTELEKYGLIACLNIMLEMGFDISKLLFPSHYMTQQTFAIILKLVWMSTTVLKVKRDANMDRLQADSYPDFFILCSKILNEQEVKMEKVDIRWKDADEQRFEELVNSQRLSLASWREGPSDKKKSKLTKDEQNQMVHIGETAIELLKRNFVKQALNKCKTWLHAKSRLSVFFGETEAAIILERSKVK